MARRWIPCLLLAACGADRPTNDTGAAAPPATAHWMADTFADGQDPTIGQILLPGAFNSTSYACAVENDISPDAPGAVLALWGTGDADDQQLVVDWARTQDQPLGQQLEDGIRFIEVNVTVRDGVITTWHSVYGVPVSEVLDDVVAFAVAFPDEVIVATFGLTLSADDLPLLATELTAPRADGRSFCDLVYTGPEDAALASLSAVRASGRPVIWAPDGDLRAYLDSRGDCPTSNGTMDRAWSITVSPEGVESAIATSLAARDPAHLLVNDFVFSLDGAASVFEQADYILSYAGVRDVSEQLGFSGDFPGRLITAYNADGKMNVLAGAYYQDTDLVTAAIADNEARWPAP